MYSEQRHPLESAGVAEQLQAALLTGTDVYGFLTEVAAAAARTLAAGHRPASCGITVVTGNRMSSVASSDGLSRYMDETQHKIGAGPCLCAALSRKPMHIHDTLTETRWPDYLHAVRHSGVRSVFSSPFDLDGDSVGTLNLYSPDPDAFDESARTLAREYTEQASLVLRLALLVNELTASRRDIVNAIASRTDITLALGILMERHRCTRTHALALLRLAARDPGYTLETAATHLITSIENQADPN